MKIRSKNHLTELLVATLQGWTIYDTLVFISEIELEGFREAQFPWTAFIRNELPSGRAFCGGAVVTRRHILTAAHCVERPKV